MFNAVSIALDSDYFSCNYLFMFDPEKGEKLVSFSKYLFDVKITIGYVTLYPLIQFLVYVVFSGIGYLSYFILKKSVRNKVSS